MVESPFNNVLYDFYSANSTNASGDAIPDQPPSQMEATETQQPLSQAPANSPGGFSAAASEPLMLEPLDPSRPLPSGPSSATLPMPHSDQDPNRNSKIRKKRIHRRTRSSDVVNGLGLAAPPGVRDTLGYDNIPRLRGGSRQSPRRHRRSESLPGLGIYQQSEEGSPRLPTTSPVRESAERQRRRSLGGPNRQLHSVSESLADYSIPGQAFPDPQAPANFNVPQHELPLPSNYGFPPSGLRSAPPVWMRPQAQYSRHEPGSMRGRSPSQGMFPEMGTYSIASMFPAGQQMPQPQQAGSPAMPRPRPTYGSPYMQDRWPASLAPTPSGSTPSGLPAPGMPERSDPALAQFSGPYATGSIPGPMSHVGASIVRHPSAMGTSSPLANLWEPSQRAGYEDPRSAGSASHLQHMHPSRSPRMPLFSYTAATAAYGYSGDREGPRGSMPPRGPPGPYEYHSYGDVPRGANVPTAGPYSSSGPASPGQSTEGESSRRREGEPLRRPEGEPSSGTGSHKRQGSGRVSKHRRTRSRTSTSRRGTLARALESSHHGSSISAPTFIPSMVGSELPSTSEPVVAPGGYYWGLQPTSEEGSPQNPVPIQLCEPPLADSLPPNSGALNGDPEPRTRRRSKYTAEQDQKILDLKTEGKAWHEIAALTHCQNTLAARNRYQVLIGQQGGGTFFWSAEDCLALQQILDEGERAKWYFLAQELSKRRNREYTMEQCHYQISEMFARDPGIFSVIKTRDPIVGGAPMRRQPYKPSEAL